jgi:hypothetical protein
MDRLIHHRRLQALRTSTKTFPAHHLLNVLIKEDCGDIMISESWIAGEAWPFAMTVDL